MAQTASGNPNSSRELQAAISVMGESTPLLLQGTKLPAEAIYVISNVFVEAPPGWKPIEDFETIEISLLFGDNKKITDNIFLGKFRTELIRPVSFSRPSQISIRVSVSMELEVWVAVLDPRLASYRSIGFIDISRIEPPTVIQPEDAPPSSDQSTFPSTAEIFEGAVRLFIDNLYKRQGPSSGKDVFHSLTISFNDGINGVQKDIEVQRNGICSVCNGSGAQPGTSPMECSDCQGTGWQKTTKQTSLGKSINIGHCAACKGTGEIIPGPCFTCQGQGQVSIKYPLTVNVPAWIDSEAQICVHHHGEPGRNGGRSGYLYIAVTVNEHALFSRVGREVFICLPVSAGFAKKGGLLRVPGVEKNSLFYLELPPNTHNGAAFWVCKNDIYSLTARIETYNPYTLFAMPDAKRHLQALEEALNGREFEVDEETEEIFECDNCGTPVDTAASKCPCCGNEFKD